MSYDMLDRLLLTLLGGFTVFFSIFEALVR